MTNTFNTLEAAGTEKTLAAWGITLDSLSGEFGSLNDREDRFERALQALEKRAAYSASVP